MENRPYEGRQEKSSLVKGLALAAIVAVSALGTACYDGGVYYSPGPVYHHGGHHGPHPGPVHHGGRFR